jgi:hypothetical protein
MKKDLDNNYEYRLRHLLKVDPKELAKFKTMFAPFSSESGRNIALYLMDCKYKGERYVWRQTIIEQMFSTFRYGVSRVDHNLAQMIDAGIIEKKKKGKKDTLYGLSDSFQRMSKAMIILEEDLKIVKIKNRK